MKVEKREETLNNLTGKIIGAAIAVHKILGCGLLESAYENCLLYELKELGLNVESQKELSLTYKNLEIGCAYRLDLLVEGKVIVEVKAVSVLSTIHQAQLMSYLKLSGCRVGLLINFHTEILSKGIMRLANNF